MTSRCFMAAVAASVILTAGPVWAQPIGRILGVVRDETGDAIRGAIVRAENGGATSSPTTLTAATDDRGRFSFIVTRSGGWQLTFEAPGFDPTTIAIPIRLGGGGSAPNLDIKLERRETPEATGVMAGVDLRLLSSQLAAASTLFDEGRYDQAIAAYRDIKTRVPALTLVNLQLGNAYVMKKSYPEAEAAFQEVLKSDAEDANGLFAMGSVREAQGNAAEAANWYQKASGADVYWTRPLMKLASLASQTGDSARASQYLAQVIDIDPASADAVQAATMQKQLQ